MHQETFVVFLTSASFFNSIHVHLHHVIFKCSRMSSNGPKVPLPKPGFGLTLQRSHSGLSYSGPDSPVFLEQPPWSPDIQKCEECNRDFDFFVRRHHCRRCGRCLCERYVRMRTGGHIFSEILFRCSKGKAALKRMRFLDLVRQCNICLAKR